MRPSPARCPGAVSLPWGVPSALLLHLFLCPHPAPTQWAGGQTLVPVTLCGPATSPATACVTLHGTETRTGTMGAAPSAVETSGMASPGDTVLKKISKYIQEQNEKVYAPRGLLLTDPLERGMRVIEISIYEDRCSSGSSSSGSSSSSSSGGGGR
uniref:Golgin A7 family member B n=1 Tax=Gallus gallus TaxID=9031 RepID=A0A8V0ZB35_CHICK